MDILGHHFGRAQIIGDGRAGFFGEVIFRQDRRGQIAGDDGAGLIDQGATIAVTVETSAKIGLFSDDTLAQPFKIFILERIGFMGGKTAIRIEEQRNNGQSWQTRQQMLKEGADDTIAAIDDDLQRTLGIPQLGEIDGIGIQSQDFLFL